jgi:pyruvate dehydrogenase E2 component (dihydrolipoamide acetyltransferase)
LPDLGEGLTEADIVAWRVQVGDVVALNQVVVEVETAKAVVELPSPFAGTVVELLAGEGSTVAVGSPLLTIETAAGAERAAADTGPARGQAAGGREAVLVGYGPAPPPASRRRRRGHRGAAGAAPVRSGPKPLAAPPVRFMARQQGVDLARVTGRGPGGIVTREDLAAHLAACAPGTSGVDASHETRTAVRGVRKRMAEAMVRSVATAPQACVFLTVDVTPTTELVERLRGNEHFVGVRVTPLTFVAKAVLVALRDHPALNSAWDEVGPAVVTKHSVHLGFAVAAPSGLLVPNIKDAQQLTLRDLAAALSALTVAAREGRCTPADLGGGTFTVTNVGVFGVDGGVPILNPGEAAIFACGAVRARPWEFQGEVALRDVMTLSLAFDHRVVDGQEASAFLTAVGEILADPVNLLALA